MCFFTTLSPSSPLSSFLNTLLVLWSTARQEDRATPVPAVCESLEKQICLLPQAFCLGGAAHSSAYCLDSPFLNNVLLPLILVPLARGSLWCPWSSAATCVLVPPTSRIALSVPPSIRNYAPGSEAHRHSYGCCNEASGQWSIVLQPHTLERGLAAFLLENIPILGGNPPSHPGT